MTTVTGNHSQTNATISTPDPTRTSVLLPLMRSVLLPLMRSVLLPLMRSVLLPLMRSVLLPLMRSVLLPLMRSVLLPLMRTHKSSGVENDQRLCLMLCLAQLTSAKPGLRTIPVSIFSFARSNKVKVILTIRQSSTVIAKCFGQIAIKWG